MVSSDIYLDWDQRVRIEAERLYKENPKLYGLEQKKNGGTTDEI